MELEPTGQIQILIVEDDPVDEELTLRALQRLGLADGVFVVRDGAAALDFIFGRGRYVGRKGEKSPRLVLLDLNLPLLDGIEVLRVLKRHQTAREIPVAVLTTSTQENHKVDSYILGVKGYIVKSVDFDTFAEDLDEIVRFMAPVDETFVV